MKFHVKSLENLKMTIHITASLQYPPKRKRKKCKQTKARNRCRQRRDACYSHSSSESDEDVNFEINSAYPDERVDSAIPSFTKQEPFWGDTIQQSADPMYCPQSIVNTNCTEKGERETNVIDSSPAADYVSNNEREFKVEKCVEIELPDIKREPETPEPCRNIIQEKDCVAVESISSFVPNELVSSFDYVPGRDDDENRNVTNFGHGSVAEHVKVETNFDTTTLDNFGIKKYPLQNFQNVPKETVSGLEVDPGVNITANSCTPGILCVPYAEHCADDNPTKGIKVEPGFDQITEDSGSEPVLLMGQSNQENRNIVKQNESSERIRPDYLCSIDIKKENIETHTSIEPKAYEPAQHTTAKPLPDAESYATENTNVPNLQTSVNLNTVDMGWTQDRTQYSCTGWILKQEKDIDTSSNQDLSKNLCSQNLREPEFCRKPQKMKDCYVYLGGFKPDFQEKKLRDVKEKEHDFVLKMEGDGKGEEEESHEGGKTDNKNIQLSPGCNLLPHQSPQTLVLGGEPATHLKPSSFPWNRPKDICRPKHVCGVCRAEFDSDLQCIQHVETQHMWNISHNRFFRGLQLKMANRFAQQRMAIQNHFASRRNIINSSAMNMNGLRMLYGLNNRVGQVARNSLPADKVGTMRTTDKTSRKLTTILKDKEPSHRDRETSSKNTESENGEPAEYLDIRSMKDFSLAEEVPGKKPLVCDICCKHFTKGLRYLEHLQTVHNNNKTEWYSCSTCKQFFFDANRHLAIGHEAHQIQKMKNVCTRCGRIFPNVNSFRGHMRFHSENKALKCKDCDKVFTHAYTLALHEQSHNQPKDYVCHVCEKSFSRTEYLRYHMRKHTGERPFVCEICQKSFSNSSNLSAHRRTHTGEKPHVCSVCLAAFTTSSALVVHKWQHSDSKPFQCDVCHKTFNTSNTHKRHMVLHTGKRDFKCNVCGKEFTQSSSLRIHKRLHTGERPFVCKQCGATFTQSAHLTVHLRQHTGEKPFVCKVCKRAFPRSEYLLKHCRRYHGAPSARHILTGKGSEYQARQWMIH